VNVKYPTCTDDKNNSNRLPSAEMSCHGNSHSLTVHQRKCYPVAM